MKVANYINCTYCGNPVARDERARLATCFRCKIQKRLILIDKNKELYRQKRKYKL